MVELVPIVPVSYTHLDVYKRQLKDPIPLTVWFHDLRTSDEDVIIDSNAIPGGVRNGQVYMLQLLETEDLKKLLFVINDRNIRDNNAAAQDDLQSVESPQQEPASQAVPIAKSKFQISLISNPLQKLLDIPPRSLVPVSYTHLDVYKRQVSISPMFHQ